MAHRLARAVGDLLVTLGALVLLFVLWQVWWSDVQANAQSDIELTEIRQLFDDPAPDAAAPVEPTGPATGEQQPAPEAPVEPDPTTYRHGQSIAVIHLPTLGEERVIKEGTDGDVLDQGVLGHYPGTGGPGAIGNFALAGHRTTYGRPLWAIDQLEVDDPIVVETRWGYYVYRFVGHEIVVPSQWQVLAPVPGDPEAEPQLASLVMTACHPKFSASQRWVAFATLERAVPRSQGPPPEIGD